MAKCQKYQEIKAYRVYTTDALRIIGENTAKYSGGSYIEKRYADILTPQKEETRTGEEIIDHIKNKLRGGEQNKRI